MKLCRWGRSGAERPGMIDDEGRLRDLSGVLSSIDADAISPEGLVRLAKIDPVTLPPVRGNHRLGVPYEGISKIIAIGLNYSDHARESGMAIPTEPIIFLKAVSSITGPDDDVVRPRGSTKLDWEAELAVVIGAKARSVPREKVMEHVAGFTILNDVSERGFQLSTSQWDKGKGCDTFAPIGPWLVTKEEIADPQNLDIWLDVDGRRMQEGNTRTMIFPVVELVAYCSRFFTLMPGDIISTGTPAGVGMGKKPDPVWLEPGNVMTLGIDGLGRQCQRIVAAE